MYLFSLDSEKVDISGILFNPESLEILKNYSQKTNTSFFVSDIDIIYQNIDSNTNNCLIYKYNGKNIKISPS